MTRRTALLLCTGLALGGCRARPVTPPPSAAVTLGRSVGTPLVPSTAPAADVRADDLIAVDVTWVALQTMPRQTLLPLDAQSSLTSAPLAGGPVLAAGRQTAGARFGTGPDAADLLDRLSRRLDGPVVTLGHQQAWVAPGTTVRFACEAELPTRSATIAVARPASTAMAPSTAPATTPATAPSAEGTIVITLLGTTEDRRAARQARREQAARVSAGTATRPADDAAANDAEPDDAAAPALALPTGPESAFLEHLPLSPGTAYALLVPWPPDAGPWTTLAAYIEVLPPTDPHAGEAAAAWNKFFVSNRGRPAGPTTLPGEQLSLARAIDALRTARDPRPALVYLAAVTDARAAGDVAIVADATLLAKLRASVLSGPGDAAAGVTNDALGWQMDRTALATLADALSKAPLTADMVAALAVHTGEVGRHADTLAAVVAGAGNAADLQTRLIAENYIALEDNAPASRVRAFDWLKAQGRAPADYDPLGSFRARRAAINRALAAPGVTP